MPVSISDHNLVYAVLKLKRQRPKPTFITTRSFKKYQHEAFPRDISLIPWSVVNCFDEVNDSLHAFNLLFNEVLDEHASVRTIKLRGRPNPYITDAIRELMKVRDYWRKIARRTGDPNAWTEYKNLKRTQNDNA